MKKGYIQWCGLILFILCEYLLFKNYISREIVPFYPRFYDQAWYLVIGYKLYESMIASGSLLNALMHQDTMPQTFLFPLQAAIFYFFFGASRLSSLTINFIYFALVQLFSFSLFKRITGNYFYGSLFVVFLLSVNTLSMASDFRIDFIATCLYGIFCCAVLRSDVFLSKKWTIISLAVAISLFLMRYIAGCYIIGVGILLLIYYRGMLALKNTQYPAAETKARIKNLLMFNGVILLGFIYVCCFNYNKMYDYYVRGHLNGAERLIRNNDALLEAGLTSSTHFLYYPKIFFTVHFSEILLLCCIGMFGIFCITYLGIKHYHKSFVPSVLSRKKNPLYIYKNQLVFLLICIVVPLGILSIDESKSAIVISIIMIPFLYLLIFIFSSIADKISILSKSTEKYLLIATIIFFSLFLPQHLLQLFSREQGHTWYDGSTHFDNTDISITHMVNDIGDYFSFLHWNSLNVSTDRAGDYIAFPIASFYYETHHILLDMRLQKLGYTPFSPISKQDAIDSLNHADIFFMDLSHYVPIYPFEVSIQPYHDLLREIAEKQMIRLGDYYINASVNMLRLGNYYINSKLSDYPDGFHPEILRVFVRPNLYISGGSDNFITDQGIWLNIPAVVVQQIKLIKLLGMGDFGWLKNRNLKVYAQAQINKKDIFLKSSLIISGNHYQIECELPQWQSDEALVIHLTFSDFYVDGSRHLVMPLPKKKIFLKR